MAASEILETESSVVDVTRSEVKETGDDAIDGEAKGWVWWSRRIRGHQRWVRVWVSWGEGGGGGGGGGGWGEKV
ncbi:unnamed protein product [Arabidopsis lyrata]|nr:unnamed protein product [Arabidopsis lyrata]